MGRVRRFAAAALAGAWLALGAPGAAAQMVTEVVPAGFRPVEELVEILRPLVPAPGSVGGVSGNLVIRTTPENMDALEAVLAELDRAPANLVISVRHTLDAEVRRDLAEAFATARAGDVAVAAGRDSADRRGARVTVRGGDAEGGARVLSSRDASSDRDVQRVRTVEGREAFIAAGTSVPVADRTVTVTGAGATVTDSVRYRDVTKGFYVRPRLSGDRVMLEVRPHRDTLSGSGGGRIDVRQAATTVSGTLGRWLEIGGVSESSSASRDEILRRTRSRGSSEYSVYVRVDRVP